MPEPLSAATVRALHDAGLTPGAVLGSGMEGVVVDVGDDRVAKVWHTAAAWPTVRRLQVFLDALGEAAPAVGTPRIRAVVSADGVPVTVEDRLHGRPLRTTMGDEPYVIGDDDVDDLLAVLGALAAVAPDPRLAVLPVLPSEPPFSLDTPFATSLARLVRRRVQRFHAPLAAAVDGLDALVTDVVTALEGTAGATGLVHGDLIPANVLTRRPAPPAVLDFGFLTTVGDPCFDAAVTASIFGMYGPRHRDNERVLDEAVVERFGYDPRALAVHRAAYALVTSNCYSASGRDGHFAWCVAVLERPEVRDAVRRSA